MQPAPIWTPLPGPQTDAWLTEADELFYGGSAGGGKTDLVVGLAVTAHRRSRIFRREGTQAQGIIDRSREIIGSRGSFNGQRNLWRLVDGRSIEIAGVRDEEDKKRFQGRPADLIAFDEVTEFTPSQYRFLIGWNRTTLPDQRCRVVCTGNPPTTAEGEWVIRYWAPWLDSQHPNPAEPGELRWFTVLDGEDVEVPSGAPFEHDGALVSPRSRTFIPARLADNPYLLGTGYAAVLQGMPEPLRSQMLYGDFAAGLEDDPWQVIPTGWVRAAQARWRPDGRPMATTVTGGSVPLPLSCVGVDVARGGRDQTVLARRYGTWFAPLAKHPGASTPDTTLTAGLVLAVLAEAGAGAGVAHIDAIGVGAGVYDVARQQQPLRVRAINFAAKAPAGDRTGTLAMTNLRAYAYWRLREALDPEHGDGLALPPDPELLADLCAPRWSLRVSGVQVESKEDISARIGRSPDCGDAVALAALPLGRPAGFAVGPAAAPIQLR